MPFTSRPDAMPFSRVGCTNRIGVMKSLVTSIFVILVPVSMIKIHERCRNDTGKLAS